MWDSTGLSPLMCPLLGTPSASHSQLLLESVRLAWLAWEGHHTCLVCAHVAPAASWDSWMEDPALQRKPGAASCCRVRPSVTNAGAGSPISPFHRGGNQGPGK